MAYFSFFYVIVTAYMGFIYSMKLFAIFFTRKSKYFSYFFNSTFFKKITILKYIFFPKGGLNMSYVLFLVNCIIFLKLKLSTLTIPSSTKKLAQINFKPPITDLHHRHCLQHLPTITVTTTIQHPLYPAQKPSKKKSTISNSSTRTYRIKQQLDPHTNLKCAIQRYYNKMSHSQH